METPPISFLLIQNQKSTQELLYHYKFDGRLGVGFMLECKDFLFFFSPPSSPSFSVLCRKREIRKRPRIVCVTVAQTEERLERQWRLRLRQLRQTKALSVLNLQTWNSSPVCHHDMTHTSTKICQLQRTNKQISLPILLCLESMPCSFIFDDREKIERRRWKRMGCLKWMSSVPHQCKGFIIREDRHVACLHREHIRPALGLWLRVGDCFAAGCHLPPAFT